MPELPEVETVRRGLVSALGPLLHGLNPERGRDVSQLPQVQEWYFARENLRYPLPIDRLRSLVGSRLLALERRSKYLLLYFVRDQSAIIPFTEFLRNIGTWGPNLGLCRVVIHLGMTGVLRLLPELPEIPGKHDHLWACIQGCGTHYLLYNDVRRFGFWDYQDFSPSGGRFAPLASLGPEPIPWEQYCEQAPITLALAASSGSNGKTNNPSLSLGQHLYGASRKVGRKLKPWLLDGKAVCGVGNIYCSESLWLARLSPQRLACTLSRKQAGTLGEAIEQIIAAAIMAGGTTLRDFRSSAGKPGYFQQELRAYGREGENCLRCAGRIRKIVQNQRATYFCPRCQK
ncbi:MAG: bifunctional DNA-formamidopyrimidine glycosylase/DNA-(apurinic or apyrimidinic site) lyase [Spirochaetota bacterium]